MDQQLHHTPNVQVIKKYNQQLFINLIFIPYTWTTKPHKYQN